MARPQAAPEDRERTRYTAFRCPEDLLELAKSKAKKDRRSLSNYVICLIAKDTEGMERPVLTPHRL